MKKNIKKIILSSLLVVTAFLGFIFASLLTDFSIPLIMSKASSGYVLKAGGKYYSLPVYIHYCIYDYQEDKVLLMENENGNNDYYIQNEKFDMNKIQNGYECYVEQDSYFLHEEDGLPYCFYIISSKNLRGDNSLYNRIVLEGNTISSILEMDGVLGIPLTENGEDLDPFKIVTAEKDNKVPVFNGFEGIMTTDVDNPISMDNIKKLIKAVDEVDGDLTNRIVIESDSYSDNSYKVGTYPIIFSVTDNSGNKATITINIQVVYTICPVITGSSTFTINISNPLTTEEILSHYTAEDNYVGNITSSIEIYENNYENADKTKPGDYEITIYAKDSSYNSTFKTIYISLFDDIKPLISGPSEYVKDYDNPLTLETIMESLTATDNVDGDISNSISIVEDKYSGYESKIGTYKITFNVEDNAGNISNNFIVTIKVEDIREPVFYINNIIISTHTFENLSLDNIESYLVQTSLIHKYDDYEIEILENEYDKNKRIPGTYRMLLKVKYSNGSEEKLNLSIFVNDNDHNISNEVTNHIGIYFPYLTAIWNNIVSFFSSAWTWLLNTIINPIINFFK